LGIVSREREPATRARVLALGREPSAGELESGTAFLNAQLQQRSTRDLDKPKTDLQKLALADFCQAIFALNEFIYVD
jgi:hypothetical protein